MGDSLLALPRSIRMARATMRVVRQNFALAVGYNVLAVPLAMAGKVTPLLAALAMSTSSLLVIANSLRLALVMQPGALEVQRLRGWATGGDNAGGSAAVSPATGAPGTAPGDRVQRRTSPVAAVADHDEVRDVRRVEVLSDKTISMRMLFDPGHSLEERILSEQFGF